MSINGIGQLDSYFVNLLDAVMYEKSQPLARLTQTRDTLNVQRGIYADLNSKLGDLQKAAQALISTSAFYEFKAGRQATLSNVAEGYTVATASASSSAAAGQYDLSVTHVAVAQRRLSAVQASADQALGKTGTFWVGGNGTASASVTPNTTVTAVATSAVASGLREIGAQTLTVETRDNGGVLEFRLVNADGDAVAVADKSKTDNSVTAEWQTLTAGDFDTKRGLTITFSGLAANASTSVAYTSAGAGISVAATDSLKTIVANLNAAAQPEGREITAAVVGTQITLTAANTGTNHTLLYSDGLSGGGLGISATDQQSARNASFSVNGISFERSRNTDLTNVISGVTLSLAADAGGRTASIVVDEDFSAARTLVDSFVTQFNSTQAYLREKTAITSQVVGDKTTYSRGPLAGETIFNDLQQNLLTLFMSDVSNTGTLKNLRELGISVTDDLQLAVSDGAKLEQALRTGFGDATALLSAAMSSVDVQLERFTQSSNGMLDTYLKSFDSQISSANTEIADWNVRLLDTQNSLVAQFSQMQAQLMSLTYMQQQWSSIYGGFSRLG